MDGKGNFRSVVSMSKILSGVRISTKRIVTNGNKKIPTLSDGGRKKSLQEF
uniref:Uncharacterized protein n=1 Tax=Pavo cristatus TaxID=9049 RepID=A0A8C9FZU7_PAVCR